MPAITANSFRKLKPQAKLYKVRGENLEYAVHPSGRIAVTWVNRVNGRERRVKLYSSKQQPTKDQLTEINSLYQEELRALADGIDLDAKRKHEEGKLKFEAATANIKEEFGRLPEKFLLRGAARAYFEMFEREKKTSSTEAIYLRYIVRGYRKGRGVGEMIPSDIKRHHLQAILEDIKKDGKYRTANHVKKCLSRFWLWMSNHGYEGAPEPYVESREQARDLQAKAPDPRDRYFSEDEIKAILGEGCRRAVRFQAYTALRRGEVVTVKWSDVDDQGFAEIMVKGGRKHIHYLTPQALACAERDEGFFFRGIPESSHVNANSLSERALMRFREVGVENATGHDWRSTFFSWGEREGIRERILHVCLSHRKKGLTGIYGLHEYMDEKKEALQAWADYLDGLCK